MVKALLKKQFLELFSFYFQNKKTGKSRSKGGTVGMFFLFVLLFLCLGLAFFGTGSILADGLLPAGLDWLYFCMMGMLSIALGTFGSVFNTYAGLYKAKDNDFLLSLPIPPSKLLFVRIVTVYSMSLLYSALMWIPAILKYFISGSPSALCVIFCIAQIFIIALFVTVLTCALGWVVALISTKLKNKSFVTVLASLLFLGIYYFVYFRINTFLQSITENAEMIGGKIKSVFYPFYLMGTASTGKVVPMLIVTAITAALFALTYFILSRTFIKITTTHTAEKKTEYKSEPVKTNSIKTALIKKELKRFISSPTYMLNCGLGVILSVILPIVAIIKLEDIRNLLAEMTLIFEGIEKVLPAFACCVVCLLLSMNQISAPSVSLEGSSIWILQSFPVDAREVLNAKKNLHIYLNTPGAILATAVLGVVVKADFSTIIFMILLSLEYVLFFGSFGLFLNLKNPNLTWTNENVPVKQSTAVMIGLFGGWGISVLIAGGAYLLIDKIDTSYYIFGCAIVLILLTRFLNRWIDTKGAEIFRSL